MSTTSTYPVPIDENERLDALASLSIFNTPPEEAYDSFVELAAHVFRVPIALVSLVGKDTQHFKAKVGMEACGTDRNVSFCTYAIVQDTVLVVPDAARDRRFSANPLVTGAPFIRFYAGAPLIDRSGHRVGTLCIIDRVARSSFSEHDQITLKKMARMVMVRMEMRRAVEAIRPVQVAS